MSLWGAGSHWTQSTSVSHSLWQGLLPPLSLFWPPALAFLTSGSMATQPTDYLDCVFSGLVPSGSVLSITVSSGPSIDALSKHWWKELMGHRSSCGLLECGGGGFSKSGAPELPVSHHAACLRRAWQPLAPTVTTLPEALRQTLHHFPTLSHGWQYGQSWVVG